MDTGILLSGQQNASDDNLEDKEYTNFFYLMNALNAATSDLPVSFANKMQVGVMNYKYKGIPTLKCPMDMALYLNVFWELKPATVIEFGSHMGGCALWIADMLEIMEIKTQKIISLDLDRKVNFEDSRIEKRKYDTDKFS